jgi:peptide/nickel transport system substrate-binding protein/oligopeptide transport system substrate-binding protein
MSNRLSRRQFAALLSGTVASGLLGEQIALAHPDFLTAAGTPVKRAPAEFTFRRPLPAANPSGDQLFRLTGPVVEPPTIDPALVRDLSSAFLVRLIFRGLLIFDSELKPALELAERLVVSEDGLTYTFTLDARALFHDGRNVTADDVVFSLTRALNPATANGQAALLSGPTFLDSILGAPELLSGEAETLAGVRALDMRTVEIRLQRPDAAFTMKLASAATTIVDPANVAQGEGWWRQPNGAGPFKVSEWETGQRLVLTRSRSFIDGAPALERIEMPLGPNAYGAFNLYQSDRVEVTGISSYDVDRVTAAESPLGPELIQTDLFSTEYIAFRTDVPPLDDPIVRRAIAMAFPRDKIADVMFGGHVSVAEGIVPDGMLGVEWPVNAMAYDPEGAKALFATSKYAAEPELPPILIYSTGNGAVAALRDEVETHLGLQIESIVVQSEEFFDGLALRQYPAYALYWGADYPDPASFLQSLFASGSSDNYIDYSNPDYDALLAEAAEELDTSRRAEIYQQAQQILIDDAVVIPTYHDVGYFLVKPWVKGLEYTPLGLLQLETIWIER